jgi:hypothetical protein
MLNINSEYSVRCDRFSGATVTCRLSTRRKTCACIYFTPLLLVNKGGRSHFEVCEVHVTGLLLQRIATGSVTHWSRNFLNVFIGVLDTLIVYKIR